MDLINNRKADLEIYKNLDFYEEPKEYFKDCVEIIKSIKKSPENFIDLGCANGSFLNYLSNEFSASKLYGIEPEKDLFKISKKFSNAKIYNKKLEEFKTEKRFEVITAMGLIGIFFDPVIFIQKINSLLSENGIAIILSPFNEENIDVILNHRNSLTSEWESGNNVFSQQTLNQICSSHDLSYEWKNFEISFPIKKTKDPMRNWTEKFRDKEFFFISGLNMFYTIKFLIISKT